MGEGANPAPTSAVDNLAIVAKTGTAATEAAVTDGRVALIAGLVDRAWATGQ